MNPGLWLAPVIALVLYLLPIPVSPEGHRMLAIVGIATTLWISEAIPLPVTALLVGVLTILFGIAPASEVFVTFADPIIFLFIGSFILAEAMQVHRLDQRFASTILRSHWVRAKAGRMFFIYSCTAFAISMWISNTATTAMLYPIGLSIINIFHEEERPPVAHLLLLMTSFGASIGGMATPVGTPPNLIGMGFIKNLTGESIQFLEWMKFGVPISFTIFVAIYFAMRFFISSSVFERPVREIIHEEVDARTRRGQRNVTIAFGITVVLWLFPGFVGLAGGDLKWWEAHLPESVAALLGTVLLFLLPIDWKKREFTMRWRDAANINWGIILLFGGGLVMGKFLFKTGVAQYLGDSISALYPFHSEFMYILLFTVLAVFISEFTSNTASASLILPVCIAVSQAASVDAVKVAIAATLASSLGFMLPISTAPNAIVFGSGMISIKTMARYGIVLDLIGAVLVAVGVYFLA